MQYLDEKDVADHVLPLYKKVMALTLGKTALKRLCLFCGICKSKKFYSLTRNAIKIGENLSCDSCYNIYLNFGKPMRSDKLTCIDASVGRTFLGGSHLASKCKACRLLQILAKCEMTVEKYKSLYECLGDDCKHLVPSEKPTTYTIAASVGFIRLQYYAADKWVDADNKDDDSAMEVDSGSDQLSEAREESENSGTNPPSPEENDDSNSGFNYDFNSGSMDIYEEEALVDDPDAMEEDLSTTKPSKEVPSKQQKPKDNIANSVKSSERIRRKKKVDYIVGKKNKKCVYGPDGKIIKNGKDLCDCLQEQCPGCHFPCSKCRSSKCGSECRVNRRWYYDKVEIEGTNISWTNKWVQKFN